MLEPGYLPSARTLLPSGLDDDRDGMGRIRWAGHVFGHRAISKTIVLSLPSALRAGAGNSSNSTFNNYRTIGRFSTAFGAYDTAAVLQRSQGTRFKVADYSNVIVTIATRGHLC